MTVTIAVAKACSGGVAVPNPAANPGLVSRLQDAAGAEERPGGHGGR